MRWTTPILLLLIFAAAIAARFVHIGRYTYFFDETWNDELSTGRGSLHTRLANDVLHEGVPEVSSLDGAPAWWRIWAGMDNVTHPPLYIIVLRWWRDCFGGAFPVSRTLSALLSALAVLLMFDVARTLHGTAAGLWAALLMALSGSQI